MFVDMQDPQTYWLNVTNIGLGLSTLAGLGLVAYAIGQEFLARSMQRRRSAFQPRPRQPRTARCRASVSAWDVGSSKVYPVAPSETVSASPPVRRTTGTVP